MKPISCNLNHCEMFSCILGMEDETALSIIDPVTINMDIIRKTSDGSIMRILRVHMAQLNLRLSYHDVRMFNQMLESLPQQTQYARSQMADEEHPVNFRYDCSKALVKCNGHLDDAALWLTQNAVPISYQNSPGYSPNHQIGESIFSFNNMEIVMDHALLFIIDDCQDADVPLAEISLSKLDIKHDLEKQSGISKTVLTIHYYNRFLSGWEPFIESWSCNLCWDHCFGQNLTKTRLELTLTSLEVLNMNITSSLVELYKSVKEIWTQDYYNQKERFVNCLVTIFRRSKYLFT
ncbi:intermembrane lipid transfer protein Vps13D-like isoform X2 [Halyomorpha halys]|uniref:intermembrane lipid transfer protein Vps13D-like isoform X2 n=1 Tax=Halyomorpha halys TaxID=286706 RepID=UPI0034D21CA0